MTNRRVVMIQMGARRNYIYARQLEAAGLLHSLVTDAAWPAGGAGQPTRLAARLLRRLSGPLARRTVTGVAPSRLRASLLPNLASAAKLVMHEERAFAFLDEVLAFANRSRDLAGADVVVNYQGNGGSLLDLAKRQGRRIATDFVITPKYLEIEQQERRRWPGWESEKTPPSVIDFYRRRTVHLVRLSDLYLCPSAAVARDLSELPGFDAARVRLLPYGASAVLARPSRPERGRVLFAGLAGLRKGIPYLAAAARLLKSRHREIEIVVAGAVSSVVRERPEARDLTFLGMLDRERMADQVARADLFCLPSLAEGSATSIFEALAAGVPVITTASSGSVVQDGVEGIIVPERNSEAIAEATLRLVNDRDLRAAMSAAALATAERFNDDACGEAFIAAILELTKPTTVSRDDLWNSSTHP